MRLFADGCSSLPPTLLPIGRVGGQEKKISQKILCCALEDGEHCAVYADF